MLPNPALAEVSAALRDSHARFRRFFDSTPDILFRYQVGRRPFFEYVSRAVEAVTGKMPMEFMADPGLLRSLTLDEDRTLLDAILEGECESSPTTLRLVGPAGELRWVEWHTTLVREDRVSFVEAVGRETTELHQTIETLRRSEERFALAALAANDGIWDWDPRRGEVYMSPRCEAFLGLKGWSARRGLSQWLRRIHREDRPRMAAKLRLHLHGDSERLEDVHRIQAEDGAYRWVLLRGASIRDADGRLLRMAGSVTDITAQRQAERALATRTLHDPLTGLANRTLFLDRLGQAMGQGDPRRGGRRLAVLYCDVDRFRVVNALSREMGDRLLQAVAERLAPALPEGTTLSRLGGDEFGILLHDVPDESHPSRIADELRRATRRPFLLGEQQVFTTLSIGAVIRQAGHAHPADLLRDAQIAMYRAKAEGRGRYALFDEEMHRRASVRLALEADLRRAVQERDLDVHYQPIVDHRRGDLRGFEALVRWSSPLHGMVSPAVFIPIAEDSDLIQTIGHIVLQRACADLARWREETGLPLTVHVNLSPRQLSAADIVEKIDEALAESGLDPRALTLEITETVMIENPDAARQTMEQLRDRGVSLSVDDFGTGHSSLSLLHAFPITGLKIDRSFIHGLGGRDHQAETIVRTILAMAHELGLGVVAEGIEDVTQLHCLVGMGCPRGQGFFFARPLPTSQVDALLHAEAPWAHLFGCPSDLEAAG